MGYPIRRLSERLSLVPGKPSFVSLVPRKPSFVSLVLRKPSFATAVKSTVSTHSKTGISVHSSVTSHLCCLLHLCQLLWTSFHHLLVFLFGSMVQASWVVLLHGTLLHPNILWSLLLGRGLPLVGHNNTSRRRGSLKFLTPKMMMCSFHHFHKCFHSSV